MPAKTRLVLIALWLAFSAPIAAGAAGFNQFVGFGDSNLDSGYFRYHTMGNAAQDLAIATAIANGATGGFAGNGVMSTTLLAERFGLSAAPIGGGGTNYAIGGSYAATDSAVLVSAVQQIRNYLASVNGAANPDGLYVIKSGDNDLNYVTGKGAAWIAANPGYLSQQASALATEIAVLQSAGAQTIIVANSYNYAVLAGLGGDIAAGDAVTYARSVAYGTALWSNLATAGVNFIPADIDSVVRYVVKNPTLFGFTASSVLASSSPSGVSALISILTPAQQQSYLFIDRKHVTTAGQTIIADYEYSLLTAPGQISLVVEGAVQGGLARAATIQGQIDLAGRHRGPRGINVWGSAGGRQLRLKAAPGFPDVSGTPFGGTVGGDYQLPGGLTIGAALTIGSQKQGFSTGGHFDQTDEAASLYAAYAVGPLWGDAVATYGLFQDRIERQVTFGAFTDRNNADATGESLALALRCGGDFSLGRITTGPLAGVVMQQVHLGGFTERGGSGVTSLAFGSQTRNSIVSRLGWRGSLILGDWQSSLEATWNHEWAAKDRAVTASLTSVAAPSYTTIAAPAAADWAGVSLGASYRLNARMTLHGTISTVFFDPQLASYGGELGLKVSF